MRAVVVAALAAVGRCDFLVTGTQRTGTTWVMAELAKNPCVVTASELMLNEHGHTWSRDARQSCVGLLYGDGVAAEARKLCTSKFRDALDSRANWARKNGKRGLPVVFGFKWMQSVEKDWDWIAPLWKRRDVKVVVLRRRNHVRTLVSRVANARSGKAHPDAKTAKKQAAAKVTLKTANGELHKHLKRIETSYKQLGRYHKKLVAHNVSCSMAYYEDLADDARGAKAFAELVRFVLGDDASRRCGTARNGTSSLSEVHKIHTRPLSDQIANYDQIESKLAKTHFAKFLRVDDG